MCVHENDTVWSTLLNAQAQGECIKRPRPLFHHLSLPHLKHNKLVKWFLSVSLQITWASTCLHTPIMMLQWCKASTLCGRQNPGECNCGKRVALSGYCTEKYAIHNLKVQSGDHFQDMPLAVGQVISNKSNTIIFILDLVQITSQCPRVM